VRPMTGEVVERTAGAWMSLPLLLSTPSGSEVSSGARMQDLRVRGSVSGRFVPGFACKPVASRSLAALPVKSASDGASICSGVRRNVEASVVYSDEIRVANLL
jgi:hypothetical protein